MDATPQNCLTCRHSVRTTDGKKVRCFNAAETTRYQATADVVEVRRWNVTCPSHRFIAKELV